MNHLNIKNGDTVVVITGEYKGKTGKVMSVSPGAGRVVVQNVNIVTRHTKPRRQGEAGGRIEKESSINVSNVMLVCPKCGKPTRVGHVVEGEGKTSKKFRVCKLAKCGKHID